MAVTHRTFYRNATDWTAWSTYNGSLKNAKEKYPPIIDLGNNYFFMFKSGGEIYEFWDNDFPLIPYKENIKLPDWLNDDKI